MMNVIIFICIPQSQVIVHKDSCESRQEACGQFDNNEIYETCGFINLVKRMHMHISVSFYW